MIIILLLLLLRQHNDLTLTGEKKGNFDQKSVSCLDSASCPHSKSAGNGALPTHTHPTTHPAPKFTQQSQDEGTSPSLLSWLYASHLKYLCFWTLIQQFATICGWSRLGFPWITSAGSWVTARRFQPAVLVLHASTRAAPAAVGVRANP